MLRQARRKDSPQGHEIGKQLTTPCKHDYHDYVKAILLRSVPDDLHRQVKVSAAAAGISMQDFILRAIRKEVEKGKPKK
jgi:predicted HicB family RNase H-like nuclease